MNLYVYKVLYERRDRDATTFCIMQTITIVITTWNTKITSVRGNRVIANQSLLNVTCTDAYFFAPIEAAITAQYITLLSNCILYKLKTVQVLH